MEYSFTNNWFAHAPEVWQHLISRLPARKRALEVGAFEGQSTVWILEHLLEDGGEITVIDTWEGSEEHASVDMYDVEGRFDLNINIARSRFPYRHVDKWRGQSFELLRSLTLAQYDFAYVDASHIAADVLTDACLTLPLLKPGGILVFDDYLWGDPRDVLHRPKVAIDAFVNINAERLAVLHVGKQMVVQVNGGA
jgi:predicted O-methyltransferase YrrM